MKHVVSTVQHWDVVQAKEALGALHSICKVHHVHANAVGGDAGKDVLLPVPMNTRDPA
jgi:hypothetical protein